MTARTRSKWKFVETLNYIKEEAIFNYTRMTNCTCKFRRLTTLYFAAKQGDHKSGNTRNRVSTCNATMLPDKLHEEKCCPFYFDESNVFNI